jgi:hypothetical protein
MHSGPQKYLKIFTHVKLPCEAWELRITKGYQKLTITSHEALLVEESIIILPAVIVYMY